MRLSLLPHPASRSAAIRAIDVDLTLGTRGASLRYRLLGAPDAVKRPPPQPSARADELWRTTCFEAFLATADGGYYELNFSPSTLWAVYRFDGYRAGMRPSDDVGVPVVGIDEGPARFELTAAFATRPDATRLGLSAVVEDLDGTKSYWAIAHPQGRPDFHHAETFALDLSEYR